jgi:DNA-binding transcriptional MerR regulator
MDSPAADGPPAPVLAAPGGRADPGLSAGKGARQLGVAFTTIRTWDRRYGLGPAQRDDGRHRRYDPLDLQRLQLMCRLIADGVSAAEAACLARSAARPGQLAEPPPPVAAPATPEHGLSPHARGLRRAAMNLDAGQLGRILREAVAADVAAAWTELICPVLRDIGRRHARTGELVEVEHLLSRAVSAALAQISWLNGAPMVLLACAPEEQHSLPLEALAACLAARGTPSRQLGARVPPAALAAAIARTGPRAVVLWAQLPGPAGEAQLRAALAARPRPAIIAAAGPGWDHERLPPGVRSLTELEQAVDALAELAVADEVAV